MIKIAHISDIHFRGLSRHDEYRKVSKILFDQLRDHEVDCIFLGGDIVHSKVQNISPELIDILCWWFSELAKIAPVHMMLGNHDGLVNNKERLDAISPIVDNLNNPNIFLYKDSGVYPVKNTDIEFCVFSPFDEKDGVWSYIEPSGDRISIACFHGLINSAVTDDMWVLEGGEDLSTFDNFDYVFLGDIHKHQDLDEAGRVSYSGSMIQQNYGEKDDKGWLLWEIESDSKFKKRHIKLPNEEPFITLVWDCTAQKTVKNFLNENNLSSFPSAARIRVQIPSTLPVSSGQSVSDIVRSYGHCSDRKGEFKVVTIHEDFQLDSTGKFSESVSKGLDLYDLEFYKVLYSQWLREGGTMPNEDLEITDSAISQAISMLELPIEEIKNVSESPINTKWEINRVEWDNIFAYGENNYVDFSNNDFGKIFGVFGPNGIGKSTLVAVIMYGLFNSTDRGAMSNGQLINENKDFCEARIFLTINGEKFLVTRRTDKKSKKSRVTNKVTYTYRTELSLLQEVDGKWLQLDGEQRRETDKELRSLIGTAEDFLNVSLSPQGGALEFVESGGAKRRDVLMRLLDLTVVEDLSKKVKEHYQSDRAFIQGNNSSFQIKERIREFKELEKENLEKLEEQESSLKEREGDLSNIHFMLNKSEVEKIEFLEKKIKEQESALERASSRHLRSETQLLSYRERLNKIKKEIGKINKEEIESEISILENFISEHSKIFSKIELLKNNIKRNKKTEETLSKVPCGDSFPTCPFIKSAFDSREENKSLIKELEEIGELEDVSEHKTRLSFLKNKISDYKSMEKEKRIITERVNEAIEDYLALTEEKENAESALDKTRSELTSLSEKANKKDEDRKRMEEYNLIKKEIEEIRSKINKTHGDIAVCKHEVEKLEESLKTVEKFEKRVSYWNSLIDFLSPKGVLKMILTKQIPVVNNLISMALGNSTDFSVTLDMPEDSKTLDVLMHWGDKTRMVESASGMQKLLASISIRAALHAVTPLPKSDLFIVDEGFGALDPDNLKSCFSMFDLYRKMYKKILLISHIDNVKEAVDFCLVVGKDDKGFSILAQ